MRGNTHVRCGERGVETGQKQFRYRATPRLSIIGKAGKTAMATLVERTSRYTVPVALPAGKHDATTTCNALIGAVSGMPTALVKTLTWDQGSEMAAHAAFTLATTVAVYFAHPHSPWERGTNENT